MNGTSLWLRTVLTLVLPCTFLGGYQLAAGEQSEPPLRFFLESGSDRQEILLDRPFELQLGEQKKIHVLRMQPHRRLETRDLSFEYPRHMTFEYDSEDRITQWFLDGIDFRLTVQRYARALDPDSLVKLVADAVREEFGNAVTDQEEIMLTFKDKLTWGQRLDIELAGTKIQIVVHALHQVEDRVYVVLLQDTLTEDGETTQERAVVLDALEKTLTILDK